MFSLNLSYESPKIKQNAAAVKQRKFPCITPLEVWYAESAEIQVRCNNPMTKRASGFPRQFDTKSWRSTLAIAVVSLHGVLLFTLFTAPLLLLTIATAKFAFWTSVSAGTMAVAVYISVLQIPCRFFDIRTSRESSFASRWLGLKKFRSFVGLGDSIQVLARKIDPDWKNPLLGMANRQLIQWFIAMEKFHWASLLSSLPIIVLAFYCDRQIFGFVYIFANVLYNVYPILLQRYTRRRVVRIAARKSRAPHVRSSTEIQCTYERMNASRIRLDDSLRMVTFSAGRVIRNVTSQMP